MIYEFMTNSTRILNAINSINCKYPYMHAHAQMNICNMIGLKGNSVTLGGRELMYTLFTQAYQFIRPKLIPNLRIHFDQTRIYKLVILVTKVTYSYICSN